MKVFFKEIYAVNKRLGNKVSEVLKDKVAEFKAIMPNVLDLGNPNMQDRHFEKLFRIINQPYVPSMPFNLALLIKNGIMNFKDQIQETSGSASGRRSWGSWANSCSAANRLRAICGAAPAGWTRSPTSTRSASISTGWPSEGW
jgi:hypothetical protein